MGGENPSIANSGKQAVDAIPFILKNPFSLFTPDTTEPYISTPSPTPNVHTKTLKTELPSFTSRTYNKLNFVPEYLERVLYDETPGIDHWHLRPTGRISYLRLRITTQAF
ncbi:hypothetical protein I79_007567 [Cricetulus griseus]|uniref:Uncharacterized protein n=1 Tax=Cricetulus griseus TaxID=10029 RepID=G3HAV8_CRIGR|nr:hypothetical protein I79_007567 [Cricetulus griseus]